MWFKNTYIYRFTKPFDTSLESLDEALGQSPFKPCGAQDSYQLGWTAPIDQEGAPFVHVCDKFWMLCLKKQERILPSSVINEQVAIKASEIEEQQHRKVSRKEKTELKELVTQELLPRSFTKTVRYYAYLCPSKGYLVVNTSSAKFADEFTSYLRKSIGSLPVRIPAVNTAPSSLMTAWLNEKETPPPAFEVGEESELVSGGEEKGTIKYKGLSLSAEQIEQNTALGFSVTKLAMSWRETLSFIVCDDLTLKRIKFSDVAQDKLDDMNAEGAAEKFDAGFAIMAMEFDNLIPELLEAFGGEDKSALLSNEE